MSAENAPFFIVGAGRSGTTLLRLMLAGHSHLHILPETWFVRPLVKRFPLHERLTPVQVDEAIRVITEHYRWPDMEIDAAELRGWAKALNAPRLRDIIDLPYRRHLERSGKQRFGDKTPNYIAIVPELASLYPGALFIHLIRDGRDVAISSIDAGWARYYEPKAFTWTLAMKQRRRYRGTPVERQILDVRYEDLVGEPEPTMRRICAFLGETFEPTMLRHQERTGMVPARERGIHTKLEQPVSSDLIGVWRRKLRPAECFSIEACLRRDLLQNGYGLRFSALAWRPALAATGWLLGTMAPLLRRGVPYLQRRRLLPEPWYI